MKNVFIIYKNYYLNSRYFIVFFLLLAILSSAVIIVSPLLRAKIIDSAVYFNGMNIFLGFILLAVALEVFNAFLMPYKHYIEFKIKADASIYLKEKILSRIPVLRYESLKKTTIGHVLQLVDSDIANTENLVITDLVIFLHQTIYLIVVSIIIIQINVLLIFVLIGILIPLLFISKVMIPKIQKKYEEYILKNEEITNLTDDIYAGNLAIKLSNAYTFINNKIRTILSEAQNILMKYNKNLVIHYHLFTGSFMNIGQFLLISIGAYMIIREQITIGTMIMILSYFGGLWGTFDFLFSYWTTYKERMVSVERLVNFLNMPSESNVGLPSVDFDSIILRNIYFDIDNQNVLSNISLVINRGDKILITGDNGSGKSTLVRLLVGLMSPSKGSILYNDNEISTYNLHSLRQRIIYIPAEPHTFQGSFKDNSFGNSVESSLIDLELYEKIDKNGNNLSSGEKKRLQLACCMGNHYDLYIFDEPLNFVDEVSKNEIVDCLKNEFYDKTLIIISHESSLFKFCNVKYKMEGGRLLLTD